MSRGFTLQFQDGAARSGRMTTTHGSFSTPNFMPVGTRGTVKGVDVERLREIGTEVMLVNTYHLWLRPGPEVVRDLGGVQAFTGWNGPILSDSGGYQIFSLQGLRKLSAEGVEFRSHLDGSRHFLSPEKAVQIQETLGVDIAMALDECPAADLPPVKIESSLNLTQDWARRCLQARRSESTQLFGITQGACIPELRQRAAEELAAMSENGLEFDGFGIGGLSVGEPIPQMYEVLSYHVTQLPQNKVRYLMGVGRPIDIIQAVSEGVDLFDCVMPTRSGRFGRAFVSGEAPFINVKNSSYRESEAPLDRSCGCLTCRNYSIGYIHHLFRVDEMLGPQLVSIHNLSYYSELMARIRSSIENGRFETLLIEERNRWAKFENETRGTDAQVVATAG